MGDRVRIEKYRNRIHLRTDYTSNSDLFAENLANIKSIPGASFTDAKVWTFPLDLGVCRRMRGVFADRLDIGPELTAWGRAELARERSLRATLAVDGRTPVDLPNVRQVAPTLYAAMLRRGYQTVAARFGADCGPHGNFDEQGLGKCIESFGALVEAGCFGRGLIIAPRTALTATWIPEIEKWLPELDVSVMLATVRESAGSRGRAIVEAGNADRVAAIEEFVAESADSKNAFDFLLVNPEMLQTTRTWKCRGVAENGQPRGIHETMVSAQACPDKRTHKLLLDHAYPLLHTTEWDFIIGDEVQRYLVNSKKRKASMVGLGFQTLNTKPLDNGDGMRIALTGTPMKGRPRNLFPILAWLRPKVYTSAWTWQQRYLASKPNRYTQSGVEYLDQVRPEMMAELDRELSRICIRRTSGELRSLNPAWAPPPIAYYEKWVDLGPRQRKQYDEMESQAVADISGRRLTADNTLAVITRLKEFAGCEMKFDKQDRFVPGKDCAKLDWLMDEWLPGLGISSDADDSGPKCVIASQFTLFIDFYSAQLKRAKIPHFVITGAVDDTDRARFAARFLKPGGPRVFLLNTYAGGLSLTLDSADYGAMMDETYVPDDQDQVEKRIHRTSNVEHYVKWYYVRARNTVEEGIAKMVEEKDYNAKRILDVRRGIAYARKAWGVTIKE
jgi:SNF2 family DNA or RNA helicase